jgi:hypothetical protein
MTPYQQARVIRMGRFGKYSTTIATVLGLDRREVRKVLRRNNIRVSDWWRTDIDAFSIDLMNRIETALSTCRYIKRKSNVKHRSRRRKS